MTKALDLDRSVAVSGPAGSGRTEILVRRVAALLRSGVAPERVVVLSTSGRAAARLRQRIAGALGEADEAGAEALVCTTITRFSRTLLALEPMASGYAPGTRIEAGFVPTARVSSWLERLSKEQPALAVVAERLGATHHLADAARSLSAHRDLDVVTSPLPFDIDGAHAELVVVRDALESALGQCLDPERCPLIIRNRGLRDSLGAWTQQRPAEGVPAALTSELGASADDGPSVHWAGDARELALSTLDMLEVWRERWTQAAHGALMRAIVSDLLPAVAADRRARGAATEVELPFRLADLLESNPSARARLSERFDALLVDDADEGPAVQVRILGLLARSPEAEGPWSARPPRSGALFAIGNTERAQWTQLTELITRRGLPVQRSRSHAPAPALWIQSMGDRWIRDAAAWIAQACQDGVPPSDFVVALPRWTGARRLRGELARAGVPAYVDGGPLPRNEPGRLMQSALQCLEDPAEIVALIHVLRGLFALAPGALALHAIEGGSWCYLDPEQPLGPVALAFETLRGLRESRGGSWLPILDTLLDVTGARATWALLVDGPGWLADLDAFFGRLTLAEERSSSPSGAVRELLRGEDEDHQGRPPRDALLITSLDRAGVGAAPVIVLADLVAPPPDPVAVANGARLFLPLGDRLAPPGYSAARARQTDASGAELRDRLLLLAIRATDRFVVIGDAERPADELTPALATVRERAERLEGGSIPDPAWKRGAFDQHGALIDEVLSTPSARRERTTSSDSRHVRALAAGGDPLMPGRDQPVLDSLRLAAEWWAGVRFSVPDGEGRVEGILDACFPVDPDRRRWVVIDWTAPPTDEALHAELAEHALRALALVTPCRTVEVHMIGPDRLLPPLVR